MSETSAAPEATPAAPEAKPETFSREYVEDLRKENAGLRVGNKDALNTAVTEAKAEVIKDYEGKLTEKDSAFTELQAALTEASTELLKLKAVVAAKIPVEDIEDVVALVQGADEEAVSASVERVKSLIGKAPSKVPAVDPTQGSGGHVPLNGNPVLDILKAAVGAR